MHLQLNAAAILGVAVSIYGVLQAAKKAGLDGYISGRLGVVFAVAFGFISTVAIAGNLSANTLCTALAVALAASGLHANVKTIANGTLSSASPAIKPAKLAVLLLVGLLPLGLANCAIHGAEVNVPAATQDLQLASGLVDTVAHGLVLAQDSARTLHEAGTLSDGEWGSLNGRIVAVARQNDAAISAVKAANDTGLTTGWQAALQAVAAAAGTLSPQTLNVSNPAAKATLTAALATFEAAAAAINSSFGGQK